MIRRARRTEFSVTEAKTRFLGNSSFVLLDIDMDREIGRTDRARARFDSLRKAGDRRTPTIAINRLVPLDYSLGRIAEAHTLSLQAAGRSPHSFIYLLRFPYGFLM